MKAVRAHVREGQIVLDEAVELPEGLAVEVIIPDHDELSEDDRTELEGALQESAEQFECGEFDSARAFALRLVAKP